MGLTKAQKEERERQKKIDQEKKHREALKCVIPDPIEPDLKAPEGYNKLIKGYLFSTPYMGNTPNVVKACSSATSHGSGWERTTSQGSRNLYSTELKALLAMRYEAETVFGEVLYQIDLKIEAVRSGKSLFGNGTD